MTSYNWGYLATVSGGTSADGNGVKDRLLISLTDNSYGPNGSGTSSLETAAQEASKIMDIFLTPYTTVPLTAPVNTILQLVCADFTASVFKRRTYPMEQSMKQGLQPDMINDVEGSGWFAVGLKRLQDYIKVVYALGVTVTSTISNPETYAELFKQGLITLKELRTYISDPDAVILRKTTTQDISNILNVKSDTELKTLRKYITAKQKCFVFISGDGDVSGGGYDINGVAY